MAILVALEHTTVYRFDRPTSLGPHLVRLRPAPHTRTPIPAYSLTVRPDTHFLNWQQDVFGNHLARLVFPEKATELAITVDLIADMTVINPMDFFVDSYAANYPFDYEPGLAEDLEVYRRPVGATGLVTPWLQRFRQLGETPIVDFLAEVNRAIAADIAYTVRLEHGVQTPDETLTRRIGSCRDTGWLLVAALRELGLAARFVSGYLIQLRPDTVPGEEPDGPVADFTDLHAWAEVYIPGAGWVGLDATSGLFAGEGHIPLSASPEPRHAAPISGTTGPAEVQFAFSNTVRRIREDPRVTLPYSAEEWGRVLTVGAKVDAALVEGDVRLTMGGEPTFVSRTDMESAQWHTDADGEDKRAAASALAERMRKHYAPQGVVHRGQGKWYPGEPLPRWQIGLTWRLDGEPIWQDPALFADPWGPPDMEPGAEAAAAEALARALCDGLGIDHGYLLPAWEDALGALLDEVRLPKGEPPAVDPAELSAEALAVAVGDADEADEAGAATEAERAARRATLADRLALAPGTPAGWVLPLFRAEEGNAWATTRWRTRRGRLVLTPGTSPVGLRLPLSSLGWEPPRPEPQRSTFATDRQPTTSTPLFDDDPNAPRTALCVEAREGHLYVFLPPVEGLDPVLDLLAVVEKAAAATGVPVVLEGYGVPFDARVRTLTVTPDPGVIEVNVHPAQSWDEQVEITTALATEARKVGLATEKFALDGTHTGTGGGSHITLGGPTPADSPLLRRPDLLVSLLTFWQHHPALSYLFSGTFIGPTSQAPRVDEARHDTVYELEIAFRELDKLEDPRPWQVDRALRHLLTDLTGNTHRAEFCIDKLFSPDSERGRLGLLELRGFEMPPHPQMALVQALLVRSLVSRFWSEPYRGNLVRWGTELHDRFLLPHYVAADIAEVAGDLRDHGIDFETAWLDPFVEFRFPRLGHVEVGGVELELRSAIEPWNVLGEEMGSGGTARYVDSSVEKLQVKVTGMTSDRYVVTCNGVPLPLQSTATAGVFVAGVRYRAWSPWSALHPTIDPHTPLVFDLVDRWNARSLGGCTYHVTHPGGRSYETFPVNANEAESRRSSRFTATGHSAGPVDLAELERRRVVNPEFPRTLDLRKA